MVNILIRWEFDRFVLYEGRNNNMVQFNRIKGNVHMQVTGKKMSTFRKLQKEGHRKIKLTEKIPVVVNPVFLERIIDRT